LPKPNPAFQRTRPAVQRRVGWPSASRAEQVLATARVLVRGSNHRHPHVSRTSTSAMVVLLAPRSSKMPTSIRPTCVASPSIQLTSVAHISHGPLEVRGTLPDLLSTRTARAARILKWASKEGVRSTTGALRSMGIHTLHRLLEARVGQLERCKK
jgi:hypothetical protein